jgi:murein DD-endopeptidase MepM/ murein hydrolase activator NlpD
VDFDDAATGRYVVIDHGNEVSTYYGHVREVLVEPGEMVRRGHTIATVGSTGKSTGPHLHFEVRVAGAPVDPAEVIALR